jgi:hypothetical protein
LECRSEKRPISVALPITFLRAYLSNGQGSVDASGTRRTHEQAQGVSTLTLRSVQLAGLGVIESSHFPSQRDGSTLCRLHHLHTANLILIEDRWKDGPFGKQRRVGAPVNVHRDQAVGFKLISNA